MTVQADIIYEPLSGQYTERHFEVFKEDFKIQSWTWALFTKLDGIEWAASFRGGETDKRRLELFSDTLIAFIVSDGQGYFVNVETEELIKPTSQDTIREVTSNANKSLILFADSWNIFTVDKSLEVKELSVPFEFYFVWFKQFSFDKLEIEYEEMYTGDFKTTYLDTKNLKFISKRAKVEKSISFHISRHTWATRALRLGAHIEIISKILGHANIRETMIYAKIVNSEMDKTMDLFN